MERATQESLGKTRAGAHRSGGRGGERPCRHELGAQNEPEERLDEVGRGPRRGDYDVLWGRDGEMGTQGEDDRMTATDGTGERG